MRKQLYALALCLLLTVFPLTAFAEEEPDTPRLTISCVRAEDTTLTVTVGIENNPGIAGVDLALDFNSAVLTPSGEPEMADGWDYTETFSGETLRVASVNQENIEGDGTLFTAAFQVTGSGSYALSVSGTVCACTETTEVPVELSAAPEVHFADAFVVKVNCASNGVTASIASLGECYSGAAKAILACYQGERFVGCAMEDITVIQNGETGVTFATDSFPADGTFKLLLVKPDFVPLTEPTPL